METVIFPVNQVVGFVKNADLPLQIAMVILVLIIIFGVPALFKYLNKKRAERNLKNNPLKIEIQDKPQLFYTREVDEENKVIYLSHDPDKENIFGLDEKSFWYGINGIPENLCVEDIYVRVASKNELMKKEKEIETKVRETCEKLKIPEREILGRITYAKKGLAYSKLPRF